MPAGGKNKEKIEAKRTVETAKKFIISLPSEKAHTGHPTGQAGVYAQKLHPEISQKIVELVEAGVADTNEINHSLKYQPKTGPETTTWR